MMFNTARAGKIGDNDNVLYSCLAGIRIMVWTYSISQHDMMQVCVVLTQRLPGVVPVHRHELTKHGLQAGSPDLVPAIVIVTIARCIWVVGHQTSAKHVAQAYFDRVLSLLTTSTLETVLVSDILRRPLYLILPSRCGSRPSRCEHRRQRYVRPKRVLVSREGPGTQLLAIPLVRQSTLLLCVRFDLLTVTRPRK
jgi:hypothetical protein